MAGWDRHSRVPAHLVPSDWVETELVSRDDAAEKLLIRLDRFTPKMSEHSSNRERMLQLLRAHAMAEGDTAARHAACHRLGVTPDWHELVGGLNAERVCGVPSAEMAAVEPAES